jgi:acyl dehydratase
MEPEPFRTATFTPERIAQFSAAMRDPNPVHLDARFCKALGLPGVIAPGGMAVVALAHAATLRFGLEAVREIDVSFRSPVHAGERLTCLLAPRAAPTSPGIVGYSAQAVTDDGRICAEATITIVIGESTS